MNASSTGLRVVGTSRFILLGTQRLPVIDFDSVSHSEFDELIFFVPALKGDTPSRGMLLRLLVVGIDGAEYLTPRDERFTFGYFPPVLQQLHLTGSVDTPGTYILNVLGSNFGSGPGAVLLLSGDGDLDGDGNGNDACSTCKFSNSFGSPSHVVSWKHDRITLQYTGMNGVLAVVTGSGSVDETQRTESASFNTTSPTIESLSPISGFATVGGEDLIILAKNTYGDPDSVRVLIGLGVQSHYQCDIISIEYPVQDDMTRIRCSVPPGQGSVVKVQVERAGVLRSIISEDHSISLYLIHI